MSWLQSFLYDTSNSGKLYAEIELQRREIRVLDLLPGTEEVLECKLRKISLDNSAESYTALSYTWGNPKIHREICCNNRQITITESLHSFLWRLRSPTETMTVWADAICINQRNPQERGQQVELMQYIYRRAKLTIADLGIPEMHPAANAFWAALYEHERDFGMQYGADVDSAFEYFESHDLPTADHPFWPLVVHSLLHPWFQRVWIIQEFALSPEVKFLRYDNLASAEEVLKFFKIWIALGRRIMSYTEVPRIRRFERWAQAVENLRTVRQQVALNQKHTMLPLLLSSRACDATDKRDKVFALLGLASDTDHKGLAVDYTLRWEYIYRDAARVFLERENAIEIFVEAGAWSGGTSTNPSGLPSWVPDWSVTYRQNRGFKCIPSDCDLTTWKWGKCVSGAAGNTEARIRFTSDVDVLMVEGSVIDRVVATSSGRFDYFDDSSSVPDQPDDNHDCHLFAFEDSARAESRALSVYPTGESVLEAYCKTLVFHSLMSEGDPGYMNTGELLESYAHFLKYRKLLNYEEQGTPTLGSILKEAMQLTLAGRSIFKYYPPEGPQATVEEVEAARKPAQKFINRFNEVSQSRTLCITQKGYMAMADHASNGNLICIFKGARYPFVLHPDLISWNSYHLKGCCYIHGLMNGEALAFDDYEEREFKIV
jgi:hypothetical protein